MIRVLLVDASNLICSMFTAVVDSEPDMQVVGCANTLEKALAQVNMCDVAIVSPTLPEDGAPEFVRSVTLTHPFVKVLVMGLAESKPEIIRYLEAGAFGYVHREDSIEKLLNNIRGAYAGEALLAPDLTAALVTRLAELSTARKTRNVPIESAALTPREREVLRLMAQDLSNREIAHRLIIEVGTVKNHVHNILAKLNLSSRRDLINYPAIGAAADSLSNRYVDSRV
ncbi:MAG TPA: response regulator transcription factor [Anaerolineae bacterium]|nr:response regulator transcription factor [Anaerolineae bacterium]